MDMKGNFIDENGNRLPLTHEEVGAKRLYIDTIKWLVGKWAPRTYGDKPQEDAGDSKQITITWQSTPSAPPPAAEPPRQITYQKPAMPGDLSEGDWAILMDVLELVKRTVPKNDDRPPAEIMGVMRDALLAHFREQEAPKP